MENISFDDLQYKVHNKLYNNTNEKIEIIKELKKRIKEQNKEINEKIEIINEIENKNI